MELQDDAPTEGTMPKGAAAIVTSKAASEGFHLEQPIPTVACTNPTLPGPPPWKAIRGSGASRASLRLV